MLDMCAPDPLSARQAVLETMLEVLPGHLPPGLAPSLVAVLLLKPKQLRFGNLAVRWHVEYTSRFPRYEGSKGCVPEGGVLLAAALHAALLLAQVVVQTAQTALPAHVLRCGLPTRCQVMVTSETALGRQLQAAIER